MPRPDASPGGVQVGRRDGFTAIEGATLSALVTLAGIELVGYRFGDSNQGITVPILKSFLDPSLYRWDAMVATGDRFPTVFYRLLAALLPGTESVPEAFFYLYLFSVAAALAGVYRIGRFFGGHATGVAAFLFAIPVRVGIANEALYRVQFSHSHLASALAIWAMVWFLEGRRWLPLLSLSIGGYIHVLYSAYVLVPCLLVVLVEWRATGTRRTLLRLAAGILPLAPFVLWSLGNRVPLTPEWLELLRLRSSFHSFPSYFGDFLPAAGFLLALGVLALSRQPREKRRLTMFFLLAFAMLFAVGTLFTEYWPVKAVLQAQPHRSWRFLMLLLYGLAAEGVIAGWRAGGLARAGAFVTGVIVAAPPLEPLLPLAVVLQAALGRPVAAGWARLLAAGILVALRDWDGPAFDAPGVTFPLALLTHPTVVGAAALGIVIALALQAGRKTRALLAAAVATASVLWLAPDTYARKRLKWETGSWREVQDWVRQNTGKDAVFLTPPQESGFRVFSERTIVGEWKDGTQQYFDDAFARDWAERMQAVGPEGYAKLDDRQLFEIARRYRATYVVIPPRLRHASFKEVYRNPHYVVYAVPSSLPSGHGNGDPR